MKICTKCNLSLLSNEFNFQKSRCDGLYPICKKCLKDENLRYKRSVIGIIKQTYADMKKRVSNPQYKYWYGKPLLSQNEFELFVDNNIDIFNKLYEDWILSGHKNKLKPSIDRKDSSIGYIESNMQFITTEENREKARVKKFWKR